MFHVGGHQGSRGRATAFSKSYQIIFSRTDWKSPLRCGIQFCTLSCILFVVGVVLTWLGIHDIFGETVPITGPILLTVGALFLILASRQFFLAHSRKKLKSTMKADLEADGKKTVVVDADDGNGPSTVVMDGEKNEDDNDEYYRKIDDEGKNMRSPTLEPGTYIWPTLPYQPSPFAAISMMLGKDPASIFAPPPPSRHGFTCAYSPATTSTSLSPSRPENATMSPTSSAATDSSLQQLVLSPAAAITSHLSLQPPAGSIPSPGTVAVVEAATTDGGPSSGSNNTNSSISNTNNSPATISTSPKTSSPIHDNVTATDNTNTYTTTTTGISPTTENGSDHSLSSKLPRTLSPGGLPAMVARDGINNFPNRTAIMMLRTLEIQETI